ncbi:PRD domain-containing protein [Buchananella felis]|uniref:PRD domain-containing protein n=1 Tax=Buchananella felis TaxID=3231492 RepID=UPI003527B8E9
MERRTQAPMELLRVFNNNVVLARDPSVGGLEVILTGRGLGFGLKPGQTIDPAKVVRKFVPEDGRDPDHMGQLLADISPEQISLVGEAMARAGLPESLTSSVTLVMALADHISFAIKRIEAGIEFEYPISTEVQSLYSEEYSQAVALLAALNEQLGGVLPLGEATAFTLHLVNAGFSTGDLSYTYTMTGVIQQMLAVVEQAFGSLPSPGPAATPGERGRAKEWAAASAPQAATVSVSEGRFITHVRYLFVRIGQGKQLVEKASSIGKAIREAYPRAHQCALKLASLIELRLGARLTNDEVAYLTLHVARLADDRGHNQTHSPSF